MTDIDTMTLDELRIAVAKEVFGYWCYHYDKAPREAQYYTILDQENTPVVYPQFKDPTEADAWGSLPDYARDIAAAWLVVEKLRDMWTEATKHSSGVADDFTHPFDDNLFFDVLRRNADRRWPWAMLYLTPESICRAALRAIRSAQ